MPITADELAELCRNIRYVAQMEGASSLTTCPQCRAVLPGGEEKPKKCPICGALLDEDD